MSEAADERELAYIEQLKARYEMLMESAREHDELQVQIKAAQEDGTWRDVTTTIANGYRGLAAQVKRSIEQLETARADRAAGNG